MIPEINQAIREYKNHRNKARRALTKLKSLEKKFYFLDRIVEPRKDTDTKTEDVELETAILNLFRSIGFKCEKPTINADVDIKIKFKEYYFGLEIKNGNMVEETKILQPEKHRLLNDDTFKPILIYNNAKNNQNWDAARIKIAEKVGLGLLLTTELKKGYLKLKNNKITFEQFINQLITKGEIKFSSRAINRAYKSEAPQSGADVRMR